MHERIYEMAAHAVSPTEAEEPILDTLCTAAEAELTRALRDGISSADCDSIFVVAASLIAAAEMLLLRSTNSSAEQFTAGEVSIRTNQTGSCATAVSLRQQAKALMRPFCHDDNFAFTGVQG